MITADLHKQKYKNIAWTKLAKSINQSFSCYWRLDVVMDNTSHANDRSLQRACWTFSFSQGVWMAEKGSVFFYENMQINVIKKKSSWCRNRGGDSVVSSDSLVFVCLLMDVGNLWISSHTSWTCGLLARCNLPKDGCDFLHCVVSCFQLDSHLGCILSLNQFIPWSCNILLCIDMKTVDSFRSAVLQLMKITAFSLAQFRSYY